MTLSASRYRGVRQLRVIQEIQAVVTDASDARMALMKRFAGVRVL